MGTLARSRFWLVTGVVVLAGVLFFVLGAMPLMRRNNRLLSQLSKRADEMERIARQGAKNPQWIQEQGKLKRELKEQYDKLLEKIRERDALLERHFRDPLTGREGPLESGRWKSVYRDKMEALREKLRESVLLVTGGQPLFERQLGREWLSEEQMHRYEKEYWIQEAIVNAIAELNAESKVVPVFNKFDFTHAPEHYACKSHASMFECWPFTLEVMMEFKFVPAFLRKLMDAPGDPAPLGIEITSVSITRGKAGERRVAGRPRAGLPATGPGELPPWWFGEAPPTAAGAGQYQPPAPSPTRPVEAEKKPQVPLPERMVTVRVRGYVPDYEEKKRVSERPKVTRVEKRPKARQKWWEDSSNAGRN